MFKFLRSKIATPESPSPPSHSKTNSPSESNLKPSSSMKLDFDPLPDQIPGEPLDWSTTPAPIRAQYSDCYVKILDNVFTPEECASLIALAESGAEWKQAAVHYGLEAHQQYVNTDYRNSERILRFDADAAEVVFKRLLPHVQELVELKEDSPWEKIIGPRGVREGRVWRLVGMNERLSFLRYGPGNYFRGHCDGQLELPDGRKSRVTVQIYLGDDGCEGGATRISNPGKEYEYFDVEPKKGRVLIFQQRGIWHSGEDVTKGIKYTLRSDLLFRDEPVEE